MDCIFCKIVKGEIPAKKVYENERIVAFYDTAPQAPVHVLVVPKKHIESADKIEPQDKELVGEIFLIIAEIAMKEGCQGAYRVINNCGEPAGQTVNHLHFHLLGF